MRCLYYVISITFKLKDINRIKNKNHHTVGIVPKANSKIAERSKIDAPKTQIHDGALSCPGACTSIKGGGVKLIVWAQTSLLVK